MPAMRTPPAVRNSRREGAGRFIDEAPRRVSWRGMLKRLTLTVVFVAFAVVAHARQAPPTASPETDEQAAQAPTREEAIAQQQAAKAKTVRPPTPNKAEKVFQQI